MSKKEIEDLLRKGAYGALMEDDNAGDKFCEEDIDQILQRRTQVITLESGTKGSTFSKATFASASTRSDIEIDDPNFWEKWAKKANLDVDELKNRVMNIFIMVDTVVSLPSRHLNVISVTAFLYSYV